MPDFFKNLSSPIIFAALIFSDMAYSATITATVSDGDKNPIEFAVITLVGENTDALSANTEMPPPIMVQENIKFTPFVLPVGVGTTVSFPNKDNIRHHVYSFSKVKRFELELYGGEEEKSVHFDKQGVVALGCNIHDDMLAYIYIAPSDKFATTQSDGRMSISGLNAGTYKAIVWHPRIKGNLQDYEQEITVNIDDDAVLNFTISLKRERKRKKKGNY